MDYQSIRIPTEKFVYDHLWNLFQADQIKNILKEIRNDDEAEYLNQILEGQFFKVTKSVAPKLYNTFKEILNSLNFQDNITLYINSDPTINAFTVPSMHTEFPHIIVLNSGLVEKFTSSEMSFVLGHEIGHLIYKTRLLNEIINFVFPKENSIPSMLQIKINLWQKLSELNADRIGLLVSKNMNSCLKAFIKMTSGILPEKIEMDIDSYIKDIEIIYENLQEHFISNSNGSSHPMVPIRIKMLSVFNNSHVYENFKTEGTLSKSSKLDEESKEVAAILLKYGDTGIDMHRKVFITTAGLLMAAQDDTINDQEKKQIMYNLSGLEIFPETFIPYLLENEEFDIGSNFEKSITNILREEPQERTDMLKYLCRIAFADQNIHQTELDFILSVGQNLLGFQEKEIYYLIAEGIRDQFYPALTSRTF